MDAGIKIREATADDFEAVARLTVAAYRALPVWVGDDYAVALADVAGRVAAGATILVAEDGDGRPVGSVTLVLPPSPFFEWVAGVDGDCGFRMLAVDPEAQGRGIGPALVDECLRRSRAAGRSRMLIGSTPWMTTAHRIYERLGFVRRPDIDQQWGWIPGWAFELDLGENHPPRGRASVPGEMTINDTTRPITLDFSLDGGKARTAFKVVQSEFGIKPFRAFMGALKVRDDVEVELEVSLPAGRGEGFLPLRTVSSGPAPAPS